MAYALQELGTIDLFVTLDLHRLEEHRQEAVDTFLIHDHQGEGYAPVVVALNSMVIRAAEPVVVDTGMAENRDQYLADVFSLVEPEDIRWVFISHDDVDHTGNVNALMELRPTRRSSSTGSWQSAWVRRSRSRRRGSVGSATANPRRR